MNTTNPYVGPRAFNVGEMLYGRDDEARRLLDLILAERIVLLYSPSGAGKTSLIQARLIPKLEGEDFTVLPSIRVSATGGPDVVVDPAKRYLVGTLLSLEKAFPAEKQLPIEELLSLDLRQYLKLRYPAREPSADGSPADDLIVLIFDQFEELITLDPTDGEAKHDFLRQVGSALRNDRYWALFAMREDFIAYLDTYAQAVPTRFRNRFRLDFLDRTHAADAIRKPAEDRGVKFTAAEKLADDLSQIRVQQADGTAVPKSGGPVEPVQLQVVCRRIWEKPRQKADEISEGDLSISGASDVDSALAEYYEERVKSIAAETKVSERAIREWFSHLITERGIRGQVLRGPTSSEGLENVAIDALARDYIIRAEDRRGGTWYELAHDRLVEPIRTSNLTWAQKNLNTLQSCAVAWEAKDKRSQYLLRDEALVAAERWARDHPDQITPREEVFLNASRGALSELERAAVIWELGGRQEEQLLRGSALDSAQRLAGQKGDQALTSSEGALLKASMRERRRRRYLKVSLTGLGVMIVGISITALQVKQALMEAAEQRQVLQTTSNVLAKRNDRLEASSKVLLRPYSISDAAAPVDVTQRLEAQARVASLLPDVKASNTRIIYFAKPADGEKLSAALKDLHLPIETASAKTTNTTNCLWYGTDVPEQDVKLVAYALIRAGVALEGIQKMSSNYVDQHPSNRTVIQIGRDPSVADQPPFTIEGIDKAPLSALQRQQAEDQGREVGDVVQFDAKSRKGTVRVANNTIVPFQAADPSLTFAPGDHVSFELFSRGKLSYAENVRRTDAGSQAPNAASQQTTGTSGTVTTAPSPPLA